MTELGVWSVDLSRPGDRALLSDDERARAERFHFERHRRRFVAARTALRRVLGELVGRRPEGLRFDYADHGKPSLVDADGVEFNVSHSADRALIAAGRVGPVGVDVERIAPLERLEDLAARSFSEAEQRAVAAAVGEARTRLFYTVWTRKEACVKLAGDGLSRSLSGFDVPTAAGVAAAPVDLLPDGTAYVTELDAGAGFAAALALRSDSIAIERREFSDR